MAFKASPRAAGAVLAQAGCASFAATKAAWASAAVPSGTLPMRAPVVGSSTSIVAVDELATQLPPTHCFSGVARSAVDDCEGFCV